MTSVTTHTIVKNEENWVWYSLMSVKEYVAKMLVVDDASDDNTRKIIDTIKDPKLIIETVNMITPQAHTDMRNRMVAETKTDWFMLLDGDEIWNTATIKNFIEYLGTVDKNIYGVVMRTRNAIGDIYHYLPEEAGRYQLLGRKGHLTIRAFRKSPEFHWVGQNWPYEAYCDKNGQPVSEQPDHLSYFDGFYWHTTHLKRSSSQTSVLGWRKVRSETGFKVTDESEFPEVFKLPRPFFVPSPWQKLSPVDQLLATAITPFKRVRRKFLHD